MTPLDLAPEIAAELAIASTLENLGGDPELLKELLDFFVDIAPTQLDELQAAVTAGDVAGVDMQAHALKGGTANVGAARMTALARDLEMLAKSGTLDGAADLVVELRAAFDALRTVLPRIDWQDLG